MSLEIFNEGEKYGLIRTKLNNNTLKLTPVTGINFTGMFDFSKFNVFYNSYITPGTITLSASQTKYSGAYNKVTIKGDISIIMPSSWSFRGDTFSTNPNEWNELNVNFDGNIITIYNIILNNNLQAVSNTGTTTTVIGPGGQNAYELAVAAGFIGTETEWLASLNGKSAFDIWLEDNPGKTITDYNNFLREGIVDSNYIHDQGSPSKVWQIQHNLNKYPSVTVVDTANNIVEGNTDFTDINNLIITFNSAFSGTAILN